MNNPALKGEVSINKMLKLTNPGLRRFNVVVNSFGSCVSNTPEEFSRTPEMSFSEIVSQPRMFLKKLKGTIPFEELKSFADTHSRRKLNKQVDMVSGDVQLIDFAFPSISNLPDEELTIHLEPIELKRIHCIFNFPDKMESILSEAVFSGFQIHFSSPEHSSHYVRFFNSGGLESRPSPTNRIKFYKEGGNSSLGLKAEVPLPRM